MDLDTRSKNIKYSPWVKAACIILSAVMFALSAVSALKVLLPATYFGSDGISDAEKLSFYNMDTVVRLFEDNANNLGYVSSASPETIKDYYSENKENIIDSALEVYLGKKEQIIEAELEYVVNNYRQNSDELYSAEISNEYVAAIPDTEADKQKYPVDPYAPNNVKAAQKILNYAKGAELLKYETLVREDAFVGEPFIYEYTNYDNSVKQIFIKSYKFSEEQSLKKITNSVDANIKSELNNIETDLVIAENNLKKLKNIRYYAKHGDTIHTNISESETDLKTANNSSLYYIKTGKDSTCSDTLNKSIFDEKFSDCESVYICCVDEDEISGSDDIAVAKRIYDSIDTGRYFIFASVFLVIAVLLAVCLLNLSGHKNGYDGIKLAFIDKFPVDLHFVICAGIAAGLAILSAEIIDEYINSSLPESLLLIIPTAMAVSWLAVLELTASIVRLKKAGLKIHKHCLVYMITVWLFGKAKKFLSFLKRKLKTADLKYRPEHVEKRFFILSCGAIILNLLFFINCPIIQELNLFIVGTLFLIIVDVGLVVFSWKYFKNLDKIITSGKDGGSADFGSEKVPESLNALNDIIRVNNSRVKSAVEAAVKNERTKAELITNVSHDLKTPLTSIVTFVELLKARNIEDEQAREYLEILGEKSNNLKHLIENLVEASKVSSGNVKLNRTMLNLKEMALQAIVEFQSEFEQRKLDLRFNENCEDVKVFADGQQTYRILENLLSNAKKYSAEGTRVYTSIRKENDCGVFEIKNISSEPLDISAQELTERFVRGDASRGKEEGNGLGLSIAKDLCEMQNGRLILTIDGDLFKAEVYLPLRENETE